MSHIDYFGVKLIKIVKRRNSLGFNPLRENWRSIHLFNKLRAQTNLTVTGKKALNFCRNYGSFRVISLKTTFSRIEERFKLLENTWFVTLIPFQGGVFKVYHVDFKQKHINGAVWSNMYYLTILTVFVIALRRNYSSPDQMVGKNLSPFAPRLLTYYKFIVATPII